MGLCVVSSVDLLAYTEVSLVASVGLTLSGLDVVAPVCVCRMHHCCRSPGSILLPETDWCACGQLGQGFGRPVVVCLLTLLAYLSPFVYSLLTGDLWLQVLGCCWQDGPQPPAHQ